MIYVNPNVRASYRDGYVIATFIADTVSELPATNYLTGYTLEMGSTCHVIENSGDYEMKSDGTWVKRIPAELANTYTRTEIDNMVSDIDTDITSEENARIATDTTLSDALRGVLNGGSKNLCPVSSGSNTLPTRWLQINLTLPAGTYVISLGSLTSDDTDTDTCQIAFFDSSNNALKYLYPERGTDIHAEFTLTAESTFFRIYPSDSYAHSDGDTVTVSDMMITTKSDYQISPVFVPYCPPLKTVYATQYVHDSVQVNLNDISWTQSGGGLYYSQTLTLPDISLLYSVCLSGFASLRATDIIQPACRRSGGWSGFVLYANTNSFNAGAWVTVSGIGTKP